MTAVGNASGESGGGDTYKQASHGSNLHKPGLPGRRCAYCRIRGQSLMWHERYPTALFSVLSNVSSSNALLSTKESIQLHARHALMGNGGDDADACRCLM